MFDLFLSEIRYIVQLFTGEFGEMIVIKHFRVKTTPLNYTFTWFKITLTFTWKRLMWRFIQNSIRI